MSIDSVFESKISEETGIDFNKHSKTLSSPYIRKLQLRHFLLFDVLPGWGFLIAIALLWLQPITWIEISLLVGMWAITGIGITVGYHRLFTHRSFQTTTPIRVILTILGSMAGQGPLTSWVALHRRHHEYSDQQGDPHSPRLHGDNLWGNIRGFVHSHFSWMLSHEYPNIVYYAPDILRDQLIAKTSRLYPVWFLLGLILPAVVGGILSGTLQGVAYGFLWGGVVRVFFVGNIIWAINSFGHTVGSHLFNTKDYSANNIYLAVVSLGESWHNNHHAFENSAKFGLYWWQFDLGYWVILGLEFFNLAWKVKRPTSKMIESKLNFSKL